MNDTTPRGGLRTVRRRLLLAASAAVATAMVPGPALADLVGVLPRIKPSIVAVGTYQRTRSPAFQFRGTGVVVGDGRLIVTNAHVLPDTVATRQDGSARDRSAGGWTKVPWRVRSRVLPLTANAIWPC